MGRPTASNEPGHRLPSASNTPYTGGSCLRRLRRIPLPKLTVCLDVIYLVSSSCGYDRSQIEQRVAHEFTCTWRHKEASQNVSNAAIRRALSPSRPCGSVTADVHG
jgi:hypothetical protein